MRLRFVSKDVYSSHIKQFIELFLSFSVCLFRFPVTICLSFRGKNVMLLKTFT